MNNFYTYINQTRVIVIARGIEKDILLSAAGAMLDGGIRLLEVAFDQSGDIAGCCERINALKCAFDGRLCVGAGTVLTAHQAELARAAGAEFIISPNTDFSVIERTKALGMASIPGAATPTEIVNARNAGADIVKIFPANIFGAQYIKMLKAPLSHIPMMAVGNMDAEKIPQFKSAGADYFAVGGAILNSKWLGEGHFDAVRDEAKKIIHCAK